MPCFLQAGNDQNIQLLTHVVEALLTHLAPGKASAEVKEKGDVPSPPAKTGQSDQPTTVNSFLFATGLDKVNLFRLVRWVCKFCSTIKLLSISRKLA